jgi:peptidoglycan/LPS O-acetylase OafA/YrhL
MPETSLNPNERQRIPELDGLRGIAIVLVLCLHYIIECIPNGANIPLLSWMSYGWSGVDLFFVLSGFLLGGTLMDALGSSNYFQVFYVRRICRILPLYYAIFALFLVCWLDVLSGRMNIPWLFQSKSLPLISYALFFQNISMSLDATFGAQWMVPTWSLAVEEQFYLTLPLLIWIIPRKWLPYVLVVLVAAVPFLRFEIAMQQGHGMGAYMLMICRADALYLGVLAACIYRSERAWRFFTAHRSWWYIACGALLGFLGLLRYVYNEDLFTLGTIRYGFTAFALLYAVVLLLSVSNSNSLFAQFLRLKFLRWLGTISYGVYLMHTPVLGLLHFAILKDRPTSFTGAGIAVTGLSLVCTLGAAAVSWNFFEKMFVRFGQSHKYNLPAPAIALPLGVVPHVDEKTPIEH